MDVEHISFKVSLELTDEELERLDKDKTVEIAEVPTDDTVSDITKPNDVSQDAADAIVGKASVDALENKLTGVAGSAAAAGSIMRAPEQFVMGTIGKNIPIIGSIIAVALALPEVINALGELLFGAGGAFDRRFKRRVDREFLSFLSREEQKRRALGLDPLIFSWNNGFGNSAGQLTVYSHQWTKEGKEVPNYLDQIVPEVKVRGTMFLTSKRKGVKGRQ